MLYFFASLLTPLVRFRLKSHLVRFRVMVWVKTVKCSLNVQCDIKDVQLVVLNSSLLILVQYFAKTLFSHPPHLHRKLGLYMHCMQSESV